MLEHCVEMSLKSKIRHERAHLRAAAAGREDCAEGARIELQQEGSAIQYGHNQTGGKMRC
jgi:hypothetical protein